MHKIAAVSAKDDKQREFAGNMVYYTENTEIEKKYIYVKSTF